MSLLRVERLAYWWPPAVPTPALVRCEARIEASPEAPETHVLVAGGTRFQSTGDTVMALTGLTGRLPINLHRTPGTA